MIEELIERVFAARDVAHREHWRTRSYSAHMALADFYDGVIDSIDAIVEAYQGQFGLVGEVNVATTPVQNMTLWLQSEADWIQANQAAISRGSSAVSNLIDALVEKYQTTIYKLTFLQ